MKKYRIPKDCEEIEINEQGIPSGYGKQLIKDKKGNWKVVYVTFDLEEKK